MTLSSAQKKKPTAVDRLVAAMDRCAVARGEAQWTNGYRTAKWVDRKEAEPEATRLHSKELVQWKSAGDAERAFRRVVQNVLRAERRRARGK